MALLLVQVKVLCETRNRRHTRQMFRVLDSQYGDSNIRVKAVEEMLRQTEEDADKEILEMKTKYERLLRSEREGNVRLR